MPDCSFVYSRPLHPAFLASPTSIALLGVICYFLEDHYPGTAFKFLCRNFPLVIMLLGIFNLKPGLYFDYGMDISVSITFPTLSCSAPLANGTILCGFPGSIAITTSLSAAMAAALRLIPPASLASPAIHFSFSSALRTFFRFARRY